jgi:hypothetical protein
MACWLGLPAIAVGAGAIANLLYAESSLQTKGLFRGNRG